MKGHPMVIASIIFGLLMIILILPLLVGGTGSSLFAALFWALAISLAGALIFAFVNRREHF